MLKPKKLKIVSLSFCYVPSPKSDTEEGMR